MTETNVIGVLEFNSIAVGYEAMDVMVKEAAVNIVDAKTICPGKFYIIVSGEVAAVDASLSAGRSKGRGCNRVQGSDGTKSCAITCGTAVGRTWQQNA